MPGTEGFEELGGWQLMLFSSLSIEASPVRETTNLCLKGQDTSLKSREGVVCLSFAIGRWLATGVVSGIAESERVPAVMTWFATMRVVRSSSRMKWAAI